MREWRDLSKKEKWELYARLEPASRLVARGAVRREFGLSALVLGAWTVVALFALRENFVLGALIATPLLYLSIVVAMNIGGDYWIAKTAAFEALEKGGTGEDASRRAAEAVRLHSWVWGSKYG